jgi:hypothetical protein
MDKKNLFLPAVVTSLLLLPLTGQSAVTFINSQGAGGSERCLVGPTCSGGAYNGAISIVAAIEKDLGLTAGTITRVDDSLDTIWQNTVSNGGQVLARARYAGDTNYLGYDSGAGYQFLANSANNFKVMVDNTALFNTDPKKTDFMDYGTPNWVTIPTAVSQPFSFILFDQSQNKKYTSNNSGAGIGSSGYANTAGSELGLDHMVTFKIANDHYLIAWEDRPINGSDKDFNDYVAEVRFVQTVPVPAAAWLMGSGLIALSAVARRRK